jgi:alpha-galactosidase
VRFCANLPAACCVEVPCLVDRNGVQPTQIGLLPRSAQQ